MEFLSIYNSSAEPRHYDKLNRGSKTFGYSHCTDKIFKVLIDRIYSS